MSFTVMNEKCGQCLMGKNKIVSDARRKQIIRETRAKDCHFVCHKAQINGHLAACRGHFDAFGGGQLGRIAERLGMVEFVNEDGEVTA